MSLPLKIIHFIFSVHFPFLVVLNERKTKSVGNCIPRINKELFFVYKKKTKNYILFSKGKIRSALVMRTKGIYARAHSITKFSEIMMLALLQTGTGCRDL